MDHFRAELSIRSREIEQTTAEIDHGCIAAIVGMFIAAMGCTERSSFHRPRGWQHRCSGCIRPSDPQPASASPRGLATKKVDGAIEIMKIFLLILPIGTRQLSAFKIDNKRRMNAINSIEHHHIFMAIVIDHFDFG